jgi:hypothetical protein
MMKLIGLWLALTLALGCGNANEAGSKPQKEGAADLDALAKLKDEVCACTTAACGEPIEQNIDAKVKAMHAQYASSFNKNIMHHAGEAQMAAMQCLMKLK